MKGEGHGRRFGLTVLGVAAIEACAGSGLPPVAFPWAPPEMAKNDTGAVVTDAEVRAVFRSPLPDEPLPDHPKVDLRWRRRILVTGEGAAGLGSFAAPAAPTILPRVMLARLARPDGPVIEKNGIPEGGVQTGAAVQVDLPAANKGDVIDVLFEVTYLRADLFPPIGLVSSYPTVDASVDITATDSFDLQVVTGNRHDTSAGPPVSGGGGSWSVQAENLPAAHLDPLGAHPMRSGPWVLPVMVKHLGETYADSWGRVAERMTASLGPTLQLDEAARGAFGTGLAKARLNALFERFGTAASSGLHRAPRAFSELERHEMTALEGAGLVAAANADAPDRVSVALVSGRAGALVLDDVAGLYPFTAVLAAYKEGEDWIFDDVACANCARGTVRTELAGGRALVFGAGSLEVVDVPARVIERNLRGLQFDWAVTIEGKLVGSLLVDLSGAMARTTAEAIGPEPSPAGAAAAREIITGSSVEVGEIEEVGRLRRDTPFALRLTVSGEVDQDGDAMVLPMERILGVSLPWLLPPKRAGVTILPAPVTLTSTAVLEVPPAHRSVLPSPVEIRKTFGDYQLSCEASGRVATCRRRVRIFANRIEAESYGELIEFAQAIDSADLTTVRFEAE